ncbi:MAG: 1-(5-phosphoribosyl)-5-[(5-phosphoribosylamino)methylideneamino] imidazole-4-carboxamide isomerase [Ignavibacteriales bacterium]|nr:1-(5-phosphoribosyl)-5-[(5-phosphoribosylamino)methylideneamino] imidazole-4-carboxamide isomerase [Ignavibacteriales bacterium]
MPKLLVIPSIDIKNGKTVRVVQGIPELDVAEYGNDPVDAALLWRAENAKCIHVVDHDAIWDEKGRNFKLIEKICSSVVIPVQLGGGIRNLDDAKRAIDLGIYRIVIGSLLHENRKEFERIVKEIGITHVAAAIDFFENEVIYKARSIKTGLTPLQIAKDFKTFGIERIVVTDVKANGMMFGPNIEISKLIAEVTKCKVTLSGGVRDKDDLMAISENTDSGIDSVIVGRALYENKFPCQRLWRIAESGIFN